MNTLNPNGDLSATYDSVPYSSNVFSSSQPNRLHALAKIKGLNPPELENCKVLEIGCSFGGNLLPFAIRYPNSTLVGIDLSEHQINIGRQMMRMIGVNNVELVSADISQVSFKTKFDYIICHGVFSWVPDHVREAILDTVRNYLAPNGIAYISYNTYPGWKLKEYVKDLMLFGSNPSLNRLERIDQAFETLKFTKNIWQRNGSNFDKALINEADNNVMAHSKYYIAHEQFENFNVPMYFRDFIGMANARGLGYVTDSSVPMIYRRQYQNEEFDQLSHFFNYRVESIEQFNDFLQNRTFRMSLLAHQSHLDECGIDNHIENYSNCHKFYDVHLASHIEFQAEDGDKKALWKFGSTELFSNPTLDAIAKYLSEKNEPCKVQTVINHLKKQPDYNEEQAINTLFYLIHLNSCYLSFAPEKNKTYGTKPDMFEKYRNLIQFAAANPEITNMSNRYYQVLTPFNALDNFLAPLLDGTRTLKDLTAAFREAVENGILVVSNAEGARKSADISDKELKELLKSCLEKFKQHGYFNHYS